MATKREKKSDNTGKERSSKKGKDEKSRKKKELSPEELEKKKRVIAAFLGFCLLFLGVFLSVCLFIPSRTGIVGDFFSYWLFFFFDWASYLFPLVLIFVGFQMVLKGSRLSTQWALILISLLYLDVVVIVKLVRGKGGVVGDLLGNVLVRGVGKIGTYMILSFIGIVIVMILARLSIKHLFSGFHKFVLFIAKIFNKLGQIFYSLIIIIGTSLKNFYRFLTFRSGSPEREKEILDAKMEKVPDLAKLVEGKTEDIPEVVEPMESSEEIYHIPDEDFPDGEEESTTPPKRIAFFDDEDFADEDKEKMTDSMAARRPSGAADLSASVAGIGEKSAEESDEFPTPLTGDTFEMTGGKPGGYEQLDLFGTGRKRSSNRHFVKKAPRKNYRYRLPPLNLLRGAEKGEQKEPVRNDSEILEKTLANFGVKVKVINMVRGPAVTRYELQPAKGVKVSKVTNLSNDIALALAAYSIRMEAPIPGKSAIGIEVPNRRITPVFLKDILREAKYRKRSPLSLALGKDITGKAVMGDLLKMPHLLIAGATGSGKSVCINSVITSILYKATPLDVQMIMVDPKRVELSLYEGIPHLVDIKLPGDKKIITDPKAATMALKTLGEIMDQRYEDFVAMKVRNIKEFNQKAEDPLPYIVIVIDELADLMMVSSSTVEQYICRIAQLGRASGIHLIIATQRPSVDVITGLIKANIPSRIAFAVSSNVDSRTILDRAGAEKLLGKGDMLYLPVDASEPRRIQGAFISGDEVEKVVDFWRQQPPPENIIPIEIQEIPLKGKFMTDESEDELLPDALEIIKISRQASVSNLQRKMKIGYARAGRIMDQLERKGIVGPADGSKPRKILLPGFDLN